MIVSINGFSGSGKSTLAKQLSKLLKWPHISAGKYFRNISKIKGHSIYELSTIAVKDSSIDREITQMALREIENLGNCIFDAHGAAFITNEDSQINIFLHCPLEERARRISDLTHENYSKTKVLIQKLDTETTQRFKKVYKQDILDFKHYDLIINTNRVSIVQITDLVNLLVKLRI